jgi:hypothetical protein
MLLGMTICHATQSVAFPSPFGRLSISQLDKGFVEEYARAADKDSDIVVEIA